MTGNNPIQDGSRREMFRLVGATAVAGLASRVVGALPASGMVLVRDQKAQGSIVLGRNPNPFQSWLGQELQSYLRLLSGAEFPIVTASQAGTGVRILVGSPDSHEGIATAQQKKLVNFAGLKKDGFILQQIELEGRPAIVVGGNDDAAVMYAVYDLIERMGVVFQITGDIIPEQKPDLVLSDLHVRMEPVLKYRGLHVRPFVLPWMGIEDFRKLLDQHAKMKCNYFEFYWYSGAPWIEYSYKGEKQLIGDVQPKETGYLTWRVNTATFTSSDVEIGREHFPSKRVCAAEFQDCNTQEEAYRVGRHLLTQVIDYAHQKKIQIRLGTGDCPVVPPNLGRLAKYKLPDPFYGTVVSPGDPAAVEIWVAMMKSMIEMYPEADGYWLWLSEGYYDLGDPGIKKIVNDYASYRKLIPSMDELKKIGYDQYFVGMTEQKQIESDLGLLHCGKEITARVKQEYPKANVGVSVLGRSYLFKAMDAMLPKEVPFQSMEASICWNRGSRVPMQLFADAGGRETFLVPRLDDDESQFGMQFNVGLYEHDQVIGDSVKYGVSGVAPQTGKLRGMEQNAKYIFNGSWDAAIKPDTFYRGYVERIFGSAALPLMLKAYETLEKQEMYLGLEASNPGSHFFEGMGNFLNYADNRDVEMMGRFAHQENIFDGPDFEMWNVRTGAESQWMSDCVYRRNRYAEGIVMLGQGRDYLRESANKVLPGARHELAYLIYKIESYISHLESIRSLLAGYIAMDHAFAAARRADTDTMLKEFDTCEFHFNQALSQVRTTAQMVSQNVDHPNEAFVLFHYNVRFLLPVQEFNKFIRNMVNFYHGQPYVEHVRWPIILPPTFLNP
jgi:Glycosyl hydrolase family 67 N-terminus